MLTLRRGLVLSSVVVFALVVAAMVFATYRMARQTLHEEFALMARASATLLAEAVAAPLAQRDDAVVQELLETLVREGALVYVELRDARSGRTLAGAGDVELARDVQPAPAKSVASEGLQAVRGVYHFAYDVALGGQALAAARFGIDARHIVSLRERLAREILAVALAGLAVALLLQLAAVHWSLKRLRQLAGRADRLAAGVAAEPLPEGGGDEVGMLVRSFNRMAAALEQRVADLRASEQRQRTLVATLAEGVAIVDEQRRLLDCNDAAAQIFGTMRDAVLADPTPFQQLRFLDRNGAPVPASELPSQIALRSGKSVYGVVLGVERPDGARLWLKVNAVPRFEAGRTRPHSAVISFSDITPLMQAEQALQEANASLEARVAERTEQLAAARDLAERASRAKSEFLSRMSHELRTPLNAILGFAQILRLRMGEQAPPALAQIEAAGWHLLELINEVLELARIETGAIVVSVDSVLLAPLIAECAQLTQPLRDKHGIALFDRSAAVGEVAVAADPTRLKQVFVNLLSNAAKYNRAGGSVEVDVAADDAQVQVRVRDTGIGMSTEQLASLFQPFNRLGAERTGVEGTGIGLVIAKRLLELMGGSIAVESALGVGSVFTVTLRRAPPKSTPGAPALPAAKVDPADAAAALTLMYVEDNASNVQLMAEVLALRPQFRLLSFDHPLAAYRAALQSPPDIAVIDIALPEMDGHALCRQLRALPAMRERPIVALSANAMPSDRERGIESGFDRYFTKPLDVALFLAWLDETAKELR